jgi:hypothetical protein
MVEYVDRIIADKETVSLFQHDADIEIYRSNSDPETSRPMRLSFVPAFARDIQFRVCYDGYASKRVAGASPVHGVIPIMGSYLVAQRVNRNTPPQ